MSKTSNFDRLVDATDAAHTVLTLAEATLKNPAWEQEIFEAGHIAYGTNHAFDFEVDLLKGKPTRKWFHVRISRLTSGLYELVTYFL